LILSEASPRLYPLPESGDLLIGRSETADVRIDHDAVSRKHARLVLEGDCVSVMDLGSRNGTYVNDVRITGRRVLCPNDIIGIQGATIVFHAPLAAAESVVSVLE